MKKTTFLSKTIALTVLGLMGVTAINAQEETSEAVAVTPMVVGPGVCCGWSASSAPVMLASETDENVFTYTGWIEADQDFKFITHTDWSGTHYINSNGEDPHIIGDGTLAIHESDTDPDTKFQVSQSGNYNVTINVSELTINVVKAEYQDNPINYNILYLVGSNTPGGWSLNDATPLVQDSENPFLFTTTVPLTADGSFKIAVNCYGDFFQKMFFRDADDSGKLDEGDEAVTADLQWKVDADGNYDVTVNLLEGTISIALHEEGGDIENAISQVKAAGNTSADAYYTLSGVKVNNLTKGIYIYKGKKIVKF